MNPGLPPLYARHLRADLGRSPTAAECLSYAERRLKWEPGILKSPEVFASEMFESIPSLPNYIPPQIRHEDGEPKTECVR
jgi:hypothetical protein